MPTSESSAPRPELIMHHREVLSSTHLPARNDVVITVRTELVWDSSQPAKRSRQVVVEVSRGGFDPTPAARRKFAFVWPDADVGRLEDALRQIGWHVENRPFVSGPESEVYLDVYDWLRLGWIANESDWAAVADFHRNGETIRAELDDLTTLQALRNFIAPALVAPKKNGNRKLK